MMRCCRPVLLALHIGLLATQVAHSHPSNPVCELSPFSDRAQKLLPTDADSACSPQLLSDLALDLAYANGSCDPANHLMPSLASSDFIKKCNFTGVHTVFFITAHAYGHNQSVLLSRVLDRLDGDGHLLLIHVDDYEHSWFVRDVIDLVQVPSRCLVRFGAVVYLSATDIEMIMAAFHWLLHVNGAWTHVVTLTGQDYPLLNSTAMATTISLSHQTWIQSPSCFNADALPEGSNWNNYNRMVTFMFPCVHDDGKMRIIQAPRSPWVFSSANDHSNVTFTKLSKFCKSTPLFNNIWTRQTVDYLLHDPTPIAAYAFFHRSGAASVEHFWASLLMSNRAEDLHVQSPCLMSWHDGVGYDGTKATIDGTHNTFYTMEQKDLLQDAFKKGTPFARKFLQSNTDVLNFIDGLSS